MRTVDEIVALYEDRKKRLEPMHQRMCEVRDVVQGDVTVPLPEIDESERPAIPNLLAVGLDQQALRVASTMPTVHTPVLRPGIKASEQNARIRNQIIAHWWDTDRMRLKNRQRARQIIAYGVSASFVRPDMEYGRPCWNMRDPITTLPPEQSIGDLVPDDCIFTHVWTEAKLRRSYPDAWAKLTANDKGKAGDRKFRVIEYCDDLEYVMVACPDKTVDPSKTGWGSIINNEQAGPIGAELVRAPNFAGRPLAVVAGRVGLDRIQSNMHQLVGLYMAQAKLFALEVIGMQRAVWPETWSMFPEGSNGKIVTMADPLQGQVGRIDGGTIQWFTPSPSPMGIGLVDRLERNIRVAGGIPAEFGGESSSNIRTGRRGDSVISATVDFPIQDTQELIEAVMEEENKVAIAIDKTFFAGSKSVYFSSTAGKVTYDANALWETDANTVRYSHSGVDLQGLVIEAGQRVGIGSLSKESFMQIDPLVRDVEAEKDRIKAEALEDALLSSIQMRAQQDPTFVEPLAKLIRKVRTNKAELAEAYIEADEELRQEQAEAAQGAEVPPEAQMPGMAQPDAIAAIQPQEPSLQNLAMMLQSMRTTSRGAA